MLMTTMRFCCVNFNDEVVICVMGNNEVVIVVLMVTMSLSYVLMCESFTADSGNFKIYRSLNYEMIETISSHSV